MMDTVWGEALKGGSRFINSTVVTELLFNEGCCVGAVLFKIKEGDSSPYWPGQQSGHRRLRAGFSDYDKLPQQHR